MSLVADSTALVVLSRVRRLGLLRGLVGTVLIPPAVHHELLVLGRKRPGSRAIRQSTWIKRTDLQDPPHRRFPVPLGLGECEAITLASERHLPLLTDDAAARHFARREGIQVIRTLALVLRAEEEGLIKDAEKLADAMRHAGFRLHPDVMDAFRSELVISRSRRKEDRLAA